MTPPDKCPFCSAPRVNLPERMGAAFACGSTTHFNSPGLSESWDCVIRQRDQLEVRVKDLEAYAERLEDAGNEMAAWNFHPRNLGGDASLADAWDQAKDTKP